MILLEEIGDTQLSKISRLGYFLGSFDPLHNGHREVVNIVLDKKLCDAVFIYCVRGESSYKHRSDFFLRTKRCEEAFSGIKNTIVSYLSPIEIQQKLTICKHGRAKIKFDSLKISGIIGSDIAINLETENKNTKIEKIRLQRQKDYMEGIIIDNSSGDSVLCVTSLPASDFIVALRENHKQNDIAHTVCGREVRSIIDVEQHRYASSSRIRNC
jgi:phosphopantetheine adenylyltransferase